MEQTFNDSIQECYTIDVHYTNNRDYRNTVVVVGVSRETLEMLFIKNKYFCSTWCRCEGNPVTDYKVFLLNDVRYYALYKNLLKLQKK